MPKYAQKASQLTNDDFDWIDDSTYMLTGVSLSQCIKSMCREDIPVSAVWEISSSTSFRTLEQFNTVLMIYAECSWNKFPDKAIAIAQQLKREGKIFQAQILPGQVPSPSGYKRDIWLEHGTLDYRNEYKEYTNEK